MKKLLVIGFVLPEPKSSAAGTRMLQLISMFADAGYQITFATTAQNIQFSEDLSSWHIDVVSIQLNSSTFDVFVKNLNPDIVLFDRFMTEEQFGWRVSENCPNALKILDTEDLHFLRIARQQAVKEKREFKIEDLFTETAKREVAAILRCDSTLLVSEFEKELLEKQFNINPEILVYLPIFAENIPNVTSFEDRKDFVFIGNFLHEPNFDAVKYLKTEIWTKIKAKTTNVSLQIYGAYPTQKVFDLQNTTDRFLVNGRAEDALTVIQNARVMLAPLRFGAGIKGKLLEAMQCGTPSVTTSIGSESMCGDMPWNGFVSDDIDVFVEKAILLYNTKELWQQAQSNGYSIIKNRYSRTQFVDLFFNHIYKVTENLQKFRNQNFIGQLLQHHHHASTKFMSKWIEEKNK